MGTFVSSEDPDEVPHDVTFHLHCLLLKTNRSSEKEVLKFFENNNL